MRVLWLSLGCFNEGGEMMKIPEFSLLLSPSLALAGYSGGGLTAKVDNCGSGEHGGTSVTITNSTD